MVDYIIISKPPLTIVRSRRSGRSWSFQIWKNMISSYTFQSSTRYLNIGAGYILRSCFTKWQCFICLIQLATKHLKFQGLWYVSGAEGNMDGQKCHQYSFGKGPDQWKATLELKIWTKRKLQIYSAMVLKIFSKCIFISQLHFMFILIVLPQFNFLI